MTPDEPEEQPGPTSPAVRPLALLPAGPTTLLLGQGHAATVANVDDPGKNDSFAAANEFADSPLEMREECPAEDRKTYVSPYVADRLTKEFAEWKATKGRGYVAHVAKQTGFVPATISAVKDKNRGVGERLEIALEKFWGMKKGELLEVAIAWCNGRPPPPTAPTTEAPRDPLVVIIEEAIKQKNIPMLKAAAKLLDETIAEVGNTQLEAAKARTTPSGPKNSSSDESVSPPSHKRASDTTKRTHPSRSDR